MFFAFGDLQKTDFWLKRYAFLCLKLMTSPWNRQNSRNHALKRSRTDAGSCPYRQRRPFVRPRMVCEWFSISERTLIRFFGILIALSSASDSSLSAVVFRRIFQCCVRLRSDFSIAVVSFVYDLFFSILKVIYHFHVELGTLLSCPETFEAKENSS